MAAAPRSVFSVRASARRPPRPLAVAILGLAAFVPPGMGPRAAGDAADVPYTSGDEIAFTEQARVALGTGPACCVGLDGDLLVVGTARWSMGQPADDPRLALADDPFMIHDPRPRWTTDSGATVFELAAAGPRRLASLPTRFAPVAIAFNGPARARPNDRPARIYVADPQYVTCFEREGDRFTRRWLHQADGIRRLVFEAPDRLYVLTATGFERLQDGRDAALPLHAHVAAVSDVFPQRNTALVCSPRGDVDLLEFENGGVVRALGTVRLLGPARLARGIVGSRCLLLADRGLEQAELRDIMAAWPGRPAFFDMLETTSLGKRDRGRLGKVGVERPAEVEDLLPLGEKRAWLRYADGTVWETQLDAAGKRVEKPRRLEGLDGITAIAGDAERQAVVDRAGRVRLLAAAGSVGEPLPLVEAGPWIAAGDAVFVASGPRLHRFDRNRGLGDVVLDLGGGYLRDIGRDGDTVVVLGDDRLVTCRVEAGGCRELGAVPLGLVEPPRFLAVGPGLAVVGSGERTLTSVDISAPAAPRLLATVVPRLPVTWGGGDGYLRDVVVEADRVLVAAGELHVFDRAALTAAAAEPPAPRQVVPRHFQSFDDMAQTRRVFRIRDGLYHCSSDRQRVVRRAWLVRFGRDGPPATEYTRLGTADAHDLVMLDAETAVVAAGPTGLRAIRWPEAGGGELLGAVADPDARFEAVLPVGGEILVKDGNTIRILAMRRRPRPLRTAFTFAPAGDRPAVCVDGMPVDSPEYQRAMGYQEPLAVVPAPLGDETGWPAVEVPQGQVWIDPQRGRLKFSDGRRDEPRLTGTLTTTLWGPIQANRWLEVGPYHLCPAGELGHGLLVMDLADPDCPRQVAVASTCPNSGYANKSLGVRGHHAFVSWNHPGTAIAVLDVSDPLAPRFVRSLGLKAGIAGHMDRNWTAHFAGERMLVTTDAGLHEFDVGDPANFSLVERHEAVPPLTAWDLSRRLGAWIDRKRGEFQFVDTTDLDEPRVRGRIPLGEVLGILRPVSFDWHEDRLWIWGLTREGNEPQSVLACYDVRDPAQPRELGSTRLDGELNDILRLDGTLAAIAYRSGDLECWDLARPDAPARLGRMAAAETQGRFQFALDAAGPPVPYDNRLGAAPDRRYGQHTRFMMARGRVVWTTGPIVDFGDPARPRLRGGSMQAFDDEVRGMALAPDRRRAAWFGGVDGSGWMIDLADPRVPKLVWRLERIEPREWVGMWVPPDWQSDAPAVVETGRAFAFAGPDPSLLHRGRPMTRFASGTEIVLVSDPIAVPPGLPLTLSAVVRTKPCAPRTASGLEIRLLEWRGERPGRVLARVADEANDFRAVPLEASAAAGSATERVAVEIRARLAGWLADLTVCGMDGNNLLPNPALDRPLDDAGMHPGWTLTRVPKTVERIPGAPLLDPARARLYQGVHDSILIHDLSRPGVFAAGLLGGAVLDDHDAVLGTGLLERDGRQILLAATERGLTVNDVTDLREPVTLGRLPLPWNFAIKPWVGAVSPTTVVVATGYTSKRQTEGFFVVDVADLRRPRLQRYVRENSTPCSAHGGWLYKMSYRNGAQIFDLSDPARPLEICDFLFDRSNPGDAPTAWVGDSLLRGHAGGLESWRAPCPPQAPRGRLTVEAR